MNPKGAINKLILPLVIVCLLFVGALVFAIWAYGGRQDYKNNVDQKVSVAVGAAKQQQSAADTKQYAEAAKSPLKTFTGPEQYGSIKIQYPKTWSAYVDASGSGSAVVDGYFQPDFVPSINSNAGNTFALRLQVLPESYDQAVGNYNNQLQQKNITITAYKPANVSNIVGVRIDGAIAQNVQGSLIILPMRDKTLELWTESAKYIDDFNKIILPHFSFSP